MSTTTKKLPPPNHNFVSTRNPCKVCTPLGATLAFNGISGCIPLLHGSQGCSTYIRRYMIGHFREPVDVASSNFHEETAVFGGGANLATAIRNVSDQYNPTVIGIATTCLSETIGDDVPMFLREIRANAKDLDFPELVHVSTPSYNGSHVHGFYNTVKSVVERFADKHTADDHINLFAAMLSPADLRHLHTILDDFGLAHTLLPDYADRLDGEIWETYHRIPPGGTPLPDIVRTADAAASVALGGMKPTDEAAGFLEKQFGVPKHLLPIPIGVKNTDRFFQTLSTLSGKPVPARYKDVRGRLLDAMVDGHKYLAQKRVMLYGEPDLVIALAHLLTECGLRPVICATGVRDQHFADRLKAEVPDLCEEAQVYHSIDFARLQELAEESNTIDLLVGNGTGYKTARSLGVPLVRVGFPIHDRIGAARLLHVGYNGTQQLYDRLVNAIIEYQQDHSPVGYTHI